MKTEEEIIDGIKNRILKEHGKNKSTWAHIAAYKIVHEYLDDLESRSLNT